MDSTGREKFLQPQECTFHEKGPKNSMKRYQKRRF